MKKKINIKHFIFDLDGVLFDTKRNMQKAWSFVNYKYSLNVSFSKYFKNIGRPFKEILKIINIKSNLKEVEKDFFYYSKVNLPKVKMYSNVQPTLEKLKNKNIKMSIVTSKKFSNAKILLNKTKIHFNSINCPTNSKPGKPNPYLINRAIRLSKISKKLSCYVGDMDVDFKAAKNSKIDYIHASYGYGKKMKYKYVIKNFKNLLKFI
jgi:phosphoglycolate phosphatase